MVRWLDGVRRRQHTLQQVRAGLTADSCSAAIKGSHVWMAPAWQEIIWRAAQRSLAVMLGWTAPLPRVARLITRSGARFEQQEVDMTITVIGLDLAKNVFQVHGIDENGRAVLRRKIRRSDVLPL